MPIRTCAACRNKDEKHNKLRFYRSLDGGVSFDGSYQAKGRGFYLCFKSSCLHKAFTNKKIVLFKEKFLLPDKEELLQDIITSLKNKTLTGFHRLKSLGFLSYFERSLSKDEHKKLLGVVVSQDIESSVIAGRNSVDGHMIKDNLLIKTPFLADDLRIFTGFKKTGVVAIFESSISRRVLDYNRQLSQILTKF